MSAIAGTSWHGCTLPVVGKLNHVAVAESKANVRFGVRKKGSEREGKGREGGERGYPSREDRKVAHRVRWMRIHQRTAVAKAAPSASCAPFFALWTLRSQPR